MLWSFGVLHQRISRRRLQILSREVRNRRRSMSNQVSVKCLMSAGIALLIREHCQALANSVWGLVTMRPEETCHYVPDVMEEVWVLPVHLVYLVV